MNRVIAIPSHKRPEILAQCTLNFLTKHMCNIPIFIFCSGKQDKDDYEKYFENLEKIKITFVNSKTDYVSKQNHIHNYFKLGTEVIFIEDDIQCFEFKLGDKLIEVDDVHTLFDTMFHLMDYHGSFICGIYPCRNAGFMNDEIITDFKFIVNNCFAFISNKYKDLEVTLPAKSDYERSALYWIRYKNICRLNYICCKTKNYCNEGGLNTDDRMDNEVGSVDTLVNVYPDLFDYKNGSKSIYPELRVKHVSLHQCPFNQLYEKLKPINIPDNIDRGNASGIEKKYQYESDKKFNRIRIRGNPCKSITFGKTRDVFRNIIKDGQYDSHWELKKYLNIIKKYIKIIYPDFKYTNITLNRNFKCLPHKDKGNDGESLIFSFGKFVGGNLNIEGKSHNIYKRPLKFFGCNHEHFVEDFEGDRFSLIFYNKKFLN